MSYEKSHGKTRVTPPRASDHANHVDGANGRDRARDHDRLGRFAPGNRAAAGMGTRRSVRALVPVRARRLYADLCTQIGTSGGAIAALHAADAATHQLDALELSELARQAGLATPEGAALHARAQRSSELAIRSVTAALDAARLFARPGVAKRKAGPPPGFAGETS